MTITNFLLWLLLICWPWSTHGQRLTLLREINISQLVSISTDRYHHFFTSDRLGNVHKYDSTGKLLHVYSPQKVAGAPLIEAWPTIQIFVFYRDLQAFTFLNRFLTENRQFTGINPDIIGFARAATIASDDQVWIFDESDFSLKKLNLLTQQLSLHVPLGLILPSSSYTINYIREYQNLLFINDASSGILLFDNLGNYKKKLPLPAVHYFNFLENEVYWVSKNTIHFFNLYTLAQRSISLPGAEPSDYVLVSHTQVVLFSKNRLYIYRLQPE